ncbi:MAG: DUF4411 family protein [Pseudonocardiaceae bacterium]
MTYVFDTSSLIGAWFRTYPPDVFPRLWENMEGLARSGRLLVPEEVMFELKSQDDDLLAWVKDRADLMVTPTSRAAMLEAKAILVDHKYLTKTGTGRGRADPFVIALAAIHECSVVTQEQGGSADKPRIPYVCMVRQIPCIAILDVIRAERWRFD